MHCFVREQHDLECIIGEDDNEIIGFYFQLEWTFIGVFTIYWHCVLCCMFAK